MSYLSISQFINQKLQPRGCIDHVVRPRSNRTSRVERLRDLTSSIVSPYTLAFSSRLCSHLCAPCHLWRLLSRVVSPCPPRVLSTSCPPTSCPHASCLHLRLSASFCPLLPPSSVLCHTRHLVYHLAPSTLCLCLRFLNINLRCLSFFLSLLKIAHHTFPSSFCFNSLHYLPLFISTSSLLTHYRPTT